MGKVCDNSRREAILHVTQNAAEHITQPHQQLTSGHLDQPTRHHQRHHYPTIKIRAAAISGHVLPNYARNAATV
jgi:hypothetical protein